MRRLRHLTGQHRTPSINRLPGGVLAFTTGAAMFMLLLALSLSPLSADFHRTLRRKVKAIQQSS